MRRCIPPQGAPGFFGNLFPNDSARRQFDAWDRPQAFGFFEQPMLAWSIQGCPTLPKELPQAPINLVHMFFLVLTDRFFDRTLGTAFREKSEQLLNDVCHIGSGGFSLVGRVREGGVR